MDEKTRQEIAAISSAIENHGRVNPELVLDLTEKGEISLGGLGRIPLNLKLHQMQMILENSDKIKSFIAENIDRFEKWEPNGKGGFKKRD